MAIANSNSLRILAIDSESGTKIPIAHAQTASLSFSNSLIDVTTKSSNAFATKISGQRSYSLSTDGLLDFAMVEGQTAHTVIGTWAIAGTLVYFDFGIGNIAYVGQGFISSYEQSGGTDDAPTFSISIESSGSLAYDADTSS